MTHKAYNGRIIVAYFAECCDLVVSKNLPGDSRLFGQWLTQQVIQGKRDWPTDSEFGQLQPVCFLAGFSLANAVVFLLFLLFIFALSTRTPPVRYRGPETNQLRKSIARWFNLTERCGRYLLLGCADDRGFVFLVGPHGISGTSRVFLGIIIGYKVFDGGKGHGGCWAPVHPFTPFADSTFHED